MSYVEQDYLEETLKKINDKMVKFDQETDKIRDEIHMTATVLDKKIVHLKEKSSRNRTSMRGSQ